MCGWQAKLCDPSLTRAKLSTKRSVTNNKCYTNRLPRLIPLLICTTVHTCHMQDSKQRIQQDNERSTEQSTKPPTMNWPVNKTTHDELTSQQDHPWRTHQSTRPPTMNSPVNTTTHHELTSQQDHPWWTHQSTRLPMTNWPVNKTTHDELTSQQDHPPWTHQSTRLPTMNSPVNKTTHDELTSQQDHTRWTDQWMRLSIFTWDAVMQFLNGAAQLCDAGLELFYWRQTNLTQWTLTHKHKHTSLIETDKAVLLDAHDHLIMQQDHIKVSCLRMRDLSAAFDNHWP